MDRNPGEAREAARLIGSAPAFSAVLEQVSSVAPLNKPVLVVGERGTGKELIAARIHYLSGRWDQAFETLNCAAISESLLESELFGHEPGAFTGATRRHTGRFERSDGGSLFMDELANASLRVQEQLLRVIEYGEFQRLGGSDVLSTDVRLIAATNEDLPQLADNGKFRHDLLDRLSFDVITLPPLRDRQDDIRTLAEHFAMAMSRELERDYFAGFSERALDDMLSYPWPGNVRELKNTVERSTYRHQQVDEPIDRIIFDPFDSPYRPGANAVRAYLVHQEDEFSAVQNAKPDPRHTAPGTIPAHFNLRDELEQQEKRYIELALQQSRFHQRRAAEQLGLSYHQLRASLRKFPDLLEP